MRKIFTILAIIVALAFPFAALAASDDVSAPNISVTTSKGTATFTLKSDTAGVRIYYTTNGSTPTTSSTKYSSKVTLKDTARVYAVAYDPDTKEYSEVADYLVTVTKERVQKPTLTSKDVAGGKQITMKSTTSGATIYYTLDGSTPTTSDKRYSSPITVDESCTVRAIAVKSGMANSAVAGGYVEIGSVSTPKINITSSSKGDQITITTSTSGATIYYTTNGSTPTTKSTKYSKAFTVSKACTIRAIAVKNGYANSDVAEKDISAPAAATPTATATAIVGGYTVKLTSATSGATIYYTLDGTTPTTSSTKYTSSGISLTEPGTTYIRAIAVKSGCENSKVYVGSKDIPQASKPTVSLVNGKVTIYAANKNKIDTIYYTTNGAAPTIKSKKYSSPFTANAGTVVYAVAARSGYAVSDIAGGTIPKSKAAEPELSSEDAVYGGYTIKLKSDTSGATIYYTTDGSDPTSKSTKYTSSGIDIAEVGLNEVRAIAVKSGYDDSDIYVYTKSLQQTAKPTLTLTNGKVTISGVSGAQYYYTTNGTTPTVKSKKYSSPFSASAGSKVYAIAVRKGYAASEPQGGTVSSGSASKPEKSTESAIVGGKNVKLKSDTSGATIYYTLDGSTPTTDSDKYTTSGINITDVGTTYIYAIAVKSGYKDSAVASIPVTVTRTANPTISAQTVSSGRKITLSAASGATIYYTLNGTTPTTSSKKYSSAITVTETCQIRAMAVQKGYANSQVVGGTVTVTTPQVEKPYITQKSYSGYDRVTIKTDTSGAKIYYTLDGSDPAVYGKSLTNGSYITIKEDCELRAIATKSGYDDSDELHRYLILGDEFELLSVPENKPVESPSFTLNTVLDF
ncbi:MAG: chitobiase/beta-hexosaminidase C-terminal domain-containing protein [Oscillospiraceae bacterium]|nr:chitobiase/beta-hexosaminidase C-terminal domain-containing protein [Oscillospiraceae bacterium]